MTAARVLSVLLLLSLTVATVAKAEDTPRSGSTEVLILYINETAPADAEAMNYDTVAQWCLSSKLEKVRKIADQLSSDRELFHAAVDRKIEAIRTALPQLPRDLEFVIFTNRSVRNGRFLIGRSGESQFREYTIDSIPSDNYILTSNPNAQPLMMQKALAEVSQHFDPKSHTFILITESHGNEQMALTPRLVVRHQETSRDELLAIAEGTPGNSSRPAWLESPIGISKSQYLDIVEDAGSAYGMRFSLVFMESCKSSLPKDCTTLPSNIELMVVTQDSECRHDNLDYARLLGELSDGIPLSETIVDALEAKFTVISHPRLPWTTVLWFTPLCGWLLLIVRRRVSFGHVSASLQLHSID